ncbi:MAG: thioredoxin [Planctomycetota bacterium]|jgi:thioredoxin 1
MSGTTLDINDTNFQSEIIESGAPALLDFYATWCGPCKTLAPILDQLADEYAEKGVKVGKVDIEAAPEIAAKFGITGVPTLIFFKGGEKVDQMVGAQPKSILEKKLDEIT